MSDIGGFHSVLFCDSRDRDGVDDLPMPDFFPDLNLDQLVEAVTRTREDYRLSGFFYAPLRHPDAIGYRHEVFRELRHPPVHQAVTGFAKRMRIVRSRLEQVNRRYYPLQKQFWLLDAALEYDGAVRQLGDDLGELPLRSRALRGLRAYLQDYLRGPAFQQQAQAAHRLQEQLAGVRYTIDIRGDRIRVGRYDDEPDYSSEVADTFARFQQGAVEDHRTTFREYAEMNQIEAVVLQFVAQLHAEAFGGLNDFAAGQHDFLDPVVADFDREVQFYLAWIEYVDHLVGHELPFCLPEITTQSKEAYAEQAVDLALADKLVRDERPLVGNDIDLHDGERILVISGPNQGGKTTYARMFGQLHHLARLGCPVPARRARLFLADQIFTHFEREEVAGDLQGKLADDLLRIRHILEDATPDSVVIMNEVFTSTTVQDALYLGERIMRRLIGLDLLGVYVTFIDELSRMGPATVSMVSTVAPEDPSTRTFRVLRRPADGLAHAVTIARKYGLTYQRLKERIPT